MHSHEALGGRVLVVKPTGHLLGGPETSEFVELAREFATPGHAGVVLDFADVDYMNSLALGAITRIVIACARANGAVKVCNLTERVRRLFDVVKFYKIFDYFDTEQGAIAALSKEAVAGV